VSHADPAIPIAQARALPLGKVVTVEGSVTVPSGTLVSAGPEELGFAMQDRTAGIYVRVDTELHLNLHSSGIHPFHIPFLEPGETGRITGFVGQFDTLPHEVDPRRRGDIRRAHDDSFDRGVEIVQVNGSAGGCQYFAEVAHMS
jgi:hypothetical protein